MPNPGQTKLIARLKQVQTAQSVTTTHLIDAVDNAQAKADDLQKQLDEVRDEAKEVDEIIAELEAKPTPPGGPPA